MSARSFVTDSLKAVRDEVPGFTPWGALGRCARSGWTERRTEDDVQLGRCMWSVDNDATRKDSAVRAWLAKHPRIRLDF
jgi:hypothetical protein